jgi:hypothetical protein
MIMIRVVVAGSRAATMVAKATVHSSNCGDVLFEDYDVVAVRVEYEQWLDFDSTKRKRRHDGTMRAS